MAPVVRFATSTRGLIVRLEPARLCESAEVGEEEEVVRRVDRQAVGIDEAAGPPQLISLVALLKLLPLMLIE